MGINSTMNTVFTWGGYEIGKNVKTNINYFYIRFRVIKNWRVQK